MLSPNIHINTHLHTFFFFFRFIKKCKKKLITSLSKEQKCFSDRTFHLGSIKEYLFLMKG